VWARAQQLVLLRGGNRAGGLDLLSLSFHRAGQNHRAQFVVMLDRVTEQYVSAAAPMSSADRVHVLHRDYESRSCTVLKIAGTFKYATDPTTEVLCCAYAVDDEPVKLWTPGNPWPAEFVEAANDPNWKVCAHGAHFEDAIERYVLRPRIGWPTSLLRSRFAPRQWRWPWGCRPD
jgi:hypothetical protein